MAFSPVQPWLRLPPTTGRLRARRGGSSELRGGLEKEKGAQPSRGGAHSPAWPCTCHVHSGHKGSPMGRPPQPRQAFAKAGPPASSTPSDLADSHRPPKTLFSSVAPPLAPDRLAAPPTSPLCCCGPQPWPVLCVWHWPGCLSSHPATLSPDVSPRVGLPQHLRLRGREPGSPGSPPAATTGHGSPSGESTFIVRAYRLPARL